VYLGQYRNETVAVKQIQIRKEDFQDKAEEETQKEISVISKLRSPYIVTFYGTAVWISSNYTHLHYSQRSEQNILMILEYCKFGSLTSHFGKNTLSKALKRMIALDCAKGMQVPFLFFSP